MIREAEPEDLLDEATTDAPRLIRSFGEFINARFNEGEAIGFELRRRELGLVASVTNAGKSTLLRNALLALATGGEFEPLVKRGAPRRVLLLDFESSSSRLQNDFERMTRDWPERERALLRENLFIVCEGMVDDNLLSLSEHLGLIEREARTHRVDLIVVDTACAAFNLFDENSNSEVARKVMKPLLKLARQLDAAVLMANHIGKSRSEEGSAGEKVHKPRGASSFPGYAASVFVLIADSSDPDVVTLACAKRKSGANYEVSLKLSRASRWFTALGAATRIPTNYELVIRAVHDAGPLVKRHAIDAALKGKVPVRTITRHLNEALSRGELTSGRKGVYTV
jgi:hypothetical protein